MNASNNWIIECVESILESPRWKAEVLSFVDEHCIFFDRDEENSFTQWNIYIEFIDIVERVLRERLLECGITVDLFSKACCEYDKEKDDKNRKLLNENAIEHIKCVCDFMDFKKMMVKRNMEFELEVLNNLTNTSISSEPLGTDKSSIIESIATELNQNYSMKNDIDDSDTRTYEEDDSDSNSDNQDFTVPQKKVLTVEKGEKCENYKLESRDDGDEDSKSESKDDNNVHQHINERESPKTSNEDFDIRTCMRDRYGSYSVTQDCSVTKQHDLLANDMNGEDSQSETANGSGVYPYGGLSEKPENTFQLIEESNVDSSNINSKMKSNDTNHDVKEQYLDEPPHSVNSINSKDDILQSNDIGQSLTKKITRNDDEVRQRHLSFMKGRRDRKQSLNNSSIECITRQDHLRKQRDLILSKQNVKRNEYIDSSVSNSFLVDKEHNTDNEAHLGLQMKNLL